MRWIDSKLLPLMLRELWYVSRWDLLMRVGGLTSLLLFVFSIFRTVGLDEIQLLVVRGISIILVGVFSVFSSIWMNSFDNRSVGFTFRLGFTRPVSTFQLVAVPLSYCVVTAMLFYCVSSLVVKLLLGLAIPVLGPMLFVGCAVSIFVCTVWSSHHSLEKIIGVFGTLILIGALLKIRLQIQASGEPMLLAISQPDFADLLWYDYFSLMSISILALVVTVVSVGRQRYGEAWSWSRPLTSAALAILKTNWLNGMTVWMIRRTHRPAFRHSIAVQFWVDIRRSITQLYTIFILSLVAWAFIGFVPLVNADWGGAHSPRLFLGMVVAIPLISQLIITDSVVGLRLVHGRVVLSNYDGTRPLRCDQMIAVKILVIAGWSLVGFLWMIVVAAVHSTLAGHWHYWQVMIGQISETFVHGLSVINQTSPQSQSTFDSNTGNFSPLWWPVILGSMVVLYFASTALLITWSLWLSYYRRTFMVINGVFLSQFAVVAIVTVKGWSLKPLWLFYGYLIPCMIIVGAIAILAKAVTNRLLTGRYLTGVLIGWAIAMSFGAALVIQFHSMHPSLTYHPIVILAAAAMSVGVLASAASAPVAYAAFRHE